MSERLEVLVLGCGASGLACAEYLSKRGWGVTVADTRESPAGAKKLAQSVPQAKFVGGTLEAELAERKNLVVISPGLSPEHSAVSQIVAKAKESGIEVIGEIELFARELARLKESEGYSPKIVGITGTNGKTTTTTITGLMVAASGQSVCVAGNIGPNAIAELDRLLEEKKLPDYWVLELSSFQLATTTSLVCDAAAFLNLTQDHVDWHGSMAEYEAAKRRIFSEKTVRALNRDDAATMKLSESACSVRTFGDSEVVLPGDYGISSDQGLEWLSYIEPKKPSAVRHRSALLMDEPATKTLLMPVPALKIRGRHNAMNALAAIALSTSVGVPLSVALSVLRTYKGESHRVQFVLKTNGVEFIDDSKGTNVGATVAALVGLGANGQLSSIILGGDGKGQDFSPIAEAIEKFARHVVLIGRDADRIAEAIESTGVPTQNAGFDFEKAVYLAYEHAQPGDAVLLSPACASWDMFKNYAERSDRFVRIAKAIEKNNDKP